MDRLTVGFDSMPAEHHAYYDPEGLVGRGATAMGAIEDLLEQTDECWRKALDERDARRNSLAQEIDGCLKARGFSSPGISVPADLICAVGRALDGISEAVNKADALAREVDELERQTSEDLEQWQRERESLEATIAEQRRTVRDRTEYAGELHDLLGKARSGLALVMSETGLGEPFFKQVDAALSIPSAPAITVVGGTEDPQAEAFDRAVPKSLDGVLPPVPEGWALVPRMPLNQVLFEMANAVRDEVQWKAPAPDMATCLIRHQAAWDRVLTAVRKFETLPAVPSQGNSAPSLTCNGCGVILRHRPGCVNANALPGVHVELPSEAKP